MFEADNRVKIYLANVIFEAGKTSDAAEIVRQLFEEKYIFQKDDRMLVINIWLSLINPKRTAILNMREIQKPNENVPLAVQEMTTIVKKELDEIIDLVSNQFLKTDHLEDDVKAVFLRYLADFQRYKLDCVEMHEIPQLGSESRANYVKALDIFKSQQNPNTEFLMSTYLNYCILLADYLDQKVKAIDILSQHHHDLYVSLEKYPPDVRVKIQDLIDLMAENIQRWKPSQDEEL